MRSHWSTLAGFALVASANQMMWLNFAPITSGAATRLGVSQSDIGLLSELFPLAYVVLALPVGRALDRWFRPTLAAGASLTAAGALIRLGGDSYGWLLAGQVLLAAAQPAVLSAITGIASRYLADNHRAIGISLASAGTFAGFIEAFVLGGVLGAGRLHTILFVSAAYAVASAAWLLIGLRHPPRDAPEAAVGATTGAIRGLWSDGVLRNLTAMVFVGFGVFIAISTWAETLLKHASVSSGDTDTVLVVMVVAGVAGCAVVQPVVAKRGWQPTAIAVSAVVMVVACIVLAGAPGIVSAAGALPVMGLLLLPDLPVVLELAERRAGPHGGTATSLLWLSGNAGGVVVALVVQGLQGSAAAGFGVLAAIGLVVFPLAALLRLQLAGGAGEPRAQRPPPTPTAASSSGG
jgi:predicted MFS family arabinose efflux permease